MNAHMTWPGQTLELFSCADAALRQIPPAFPLEATVAVNPWVGQIGEDRTCAAARMARVGGADIFLPRHLVAAMIDAGQVTTQDLAAAAAAHGLSPDAVSNAAGTAPPSRAPLPTLAELSQAQHGLDWPALVEDRISHWAAAHFDRGQAFWPAPQIGAWAAWHAYASRDMTPDIAGLTGFAARVAALPTDARATFAEACQALDLTAAAAPLYFHRLLASLSGWAQYARHLGWTAERDGGRDDTLFELLTIRLVWEVALLEAPNAPADAWARAQIDYAKPIEPDAELRLDAALQEAVDLANERRLTQLLSGQVPEHTQTDRAAVQAAFCIDVRSERLRRAIEGTDPGIQTIGFAGFFGLPLRHRGHGSDVIEARAPILLAPSISTRAGIEAPKETQARVRLRTVRAWGRFKRAAVSAFAFVEAAGPLYIGKLVRDSLGLTSAFAPEPTSEPAPELDMPRADRIGAAHNILRAMSLTDGFARLVLVCGHGASVTNAPHGSALQCGACGGFAGDVNARILAGLLNDDAVRQGLAAKGIEIPVDTQFIAGLHDTVSDAVRLFADTLPDSHAADVARLRAALAKAGVPDQDRAGAIPATRGCGITGPSGPRLVRASGRMGPCRLPRVHRGPAQPDGRARP